MSKNPIGSLVVKDVDGNIISIQFMYSKDNCVHLDIGYESMRLDKEKLKELISFLECALENY